MGLSKTLNLIKKGRLNSSQGFSLVELMVVVAIIGILASIAIPNFQKFRRKSMQVEPKAVMSGLYTNQVTFSAEWNHLTADFEQLGFEMANQESTRYMTGWVSGSDAANGSSYHGPPGPGATTTNSRVTPSQCITSKRYNDDALKNSFNTGAYVFTKGTGSGVNCTGCNNSGNLTPGSCVSGSPASTCKRLWASDGKLAMRETNLQFVIGSAGDIGGSQSDQWHMAFNKKLTNVKNGVD